ncbi:hypothetical protein PL81_38475 [Streptomyces sp. RSD-27]|nr:hypothetical protein PL81_38475 [Streptomyces sp. RSD-27]
MNNGLDPREVIARSLGHMAVTGRRYGRELHADIAPWHCYTLDGGHSILVVLDLGDIGENPTRKELEDRLCPAPVKSVERAGWRMLDGYVVSVLPYDPDLGLMTPEEDDEYGEEYGDSQAADAPRPATSETVSRAEYPKQFTKRRDAELPENMRWLPQLYRCTASRLEKLERQAERQFPGIFDRLEALREQHAGQWPAWCWMPIGAVRAVLEHDYSNRITKPSGRTTLDPRMIASLGSAGDAAKLAAIGAWRSAGRHVVNFHDSMTATFEGQADVLPVGIEERWPLHGVYITFETGPQSSAGLFLHLEWDEQEQRAEFRVMMDSAPVTSLADLLAQPVFLAGSTVTEALAQTWTATLMRTNSMMGSDEILDISKDGKFDRMVKEQAAHVGVWVAAAAAICSDDVVVHDAAEALGRAGVGDTWPPTAEPDGSAPLLWMAAPRAMYEQAG